MNWSSLTIGFFLRVFAVSVTIGIIGTARASNFGYGMQEEWYIPANGDGTVSTEYDKFLPGLRKNNRPVQGAPGTQSRTFIYDPDGARTLEQRVQERRQARLGGSSSVSGSVSDSVNYQYEINGSVSGSGGGSSGDGSGGSGENGDSSDGSGQGDDGSSVFDGDGSGRGGADDFNGNFDGSGIDGGVCNRDDYFGHLPSETCGDGDIVHRRYSGGGLLGPLPNF